MKILISITIYNRAVNRPALSDNRLSRDNKFAEYSSKIINAHRQFEKLIRYFKIVNFVYNVLNKF